MKPKTVLVTAAAGRLCPIAAADASAPGGGLLMCHPGKVYRLPYSSYVRRRINAGDLELVDGLTDAPGAIGEVDEVALEGGGPPAVFGDAAPADDTAKIAEPRAQPRKHKHDTQPKEG